MEQEAFVAVGDAAPDVTIRDADGNAVRLASYWARQPAALVFIRHFG